LVGDFNARTAKLSDYIIPDENLLHDILDITDDDRDFTSNSTHCTNTESLSKKIIYLESEVL
jgi:hypothetical protein